MGKLRILVRILAMKPRLKKGLEMRSKVWSPVRPSQSLRKAGPLTSVSIHLNLTSLLFSDKILWWELSKPRDSLVHDFDLLNMFHVSTIILSSIMTLNWACSESFTCLKSFPLCCPDIVSFIQEDHYAKSASQMWRDGSAVKRSCCSCPSHFPSLTMAVHNLL